MSTIESPNGFILAICRDEKAFLLLASQKNLDFSFIIVVSDDLSVHALAKKNEFQVAFLDQMESFVDVANHVLTILGAVNSWLINQGDNGYLRKELLYWVQHVEGGDSTQRIQDAVIETRSCFALLDRYRPRKVIFCSGTKYYWEDIIWSECAKQRGVIIQKLWFFNLRKIATDFWDRMRPLAKEIYRSLVTIDAMLRGITLRYKSRGCGKYVAIQLCSEAPKHLNHTLPLVEAFKKEGLKAVIVTCDIGRNAIKLRKNNYEVAELEAWIPVVSLFYSWFAILKGLIRSKANLSCFLPAGKSGEYTDIIRPVLLRSLQSFFLSEVPYRIRLASACKAFFSHNPPVAARLWTRILFQGVIAYNSMVRKTILFWQPGWPYQDPKPYQRYEIPADMVFCLSPEHKNLIEKECPCRQKVYVAGFPWLSKVKTFRDQNTKMNSRSSLKIPDDSKFVVFLDALTVMRGYCSAKEQFSIVEAAISFAEKHESVCLLIKPHAGHKPGKLEAFFANRLSKRILWLPGIILPHDCINAADLLVTKCSTLAAEAMFFDIPSICVLSEKDRYRDIYEDAVDYACNAEELHSKLEELCDKSYYLSWQASLRERQLQYMKKHLPEPEIECNKFIARKVGEAISKQAESL